MKLLLKIFVAICAIMVLGACSDFIKVEDKFKDRLTIEKLFQNRDYIDQWLSNTYSHLGGYNQDVASKEYTPTNFADDMYFSDGNDAISESQPGAYYRYFKNVEYDENWCQNSYTECYLGINKACVFLSNIDNNKTLDQEERLDYKAQARFVRAYYYWLLLRKYGPIPLIPEAGEDYTAEYSVLSRPRATYDQCVAYITSEMVLAAKDLPLKRELLNVARPTRGAALATRAKVLLYAASPLMNGNQDAYAQQLVDDKGNRLLSPVYDEKKWALAAAAALDVMELPGAYEGHRYSLYTAKRRASGTPSYPVTTEPYDDHNFSTKNWPDGYADIDPFESYRSVFDGELSAANNPELIFTRGDNTGVALNGSTVRGGISNMVDYQLPRYAGGFDCHGLTQKQCDAYYTSDGKDCPGKDKELGLGDGSDRRTGYVTAQDHAEGRYATLAEGVSLQYADREPRFYASVAFNGSVWNFTYLEGKQGAPATNQPIWYYRDGMDGYRSGAYLMTGIGIKKYVHPQDAKDQFILGTKEKAEPAIRYAEILLIYAEAINELQGSYEISSWDGSKTYAISRTESELKRGIQPIRIRAGVPDYTEEEYANQDLFRTKLKRERQIELMGENHRYYDLRRWKDAAVEENKLIYGCNMLMNQNNRDIFHMPVPIMTLPTRFAEKTYFWPFSPTELKRNSRLTQNPGWKYYD